MFAAKKNEDKPGRDTDELEMEHNDDRLFALPQSTHQVVGHARADSGGDADEQVKGGNARVEALDHENARERNPVEEPLPHRYMFVQNKDANERGKDRREILIVTAVARCMC